MDNNAMHAKSGLRADFLLARLSSGLGDRCRYLAWLNMQFRFSLKSFLVCAIIFGAVVPVAYTSYRETNPLGQVRILEQLNRYPTFDLCRLSDRNLSDHTSYNGERHLYDLLAEHGFSLQQDPRSGDLTFQNPVAGHIYNRQLEQKTETALRVIQWLPAEYLSSKKIAR